MDENNMDENNEVESNEPGRSGRRDFLRRSAVVGGLVWAAPIVQSVGSPAFGATFSPGGGGGPECDEFYSAKYNVGTGFDEDCGEGSHGDDCFPANFNATGYTCVPATGLLSHGQIMVEEINVSYATGVPVESGNSDDPLGVKVTLPENCEIESVDTKSGSETSTGGMECSENVNFIDDQTFIAGTNATTPGGIADVSFVAFTFCCSSGA